MKKFWLLTLLWIVLITSSLAGCENKNTSPQYDEVIDYNDTIVDLALNCLKTEENIKKAYDENLSTEKIESTINSTITKCKSAINNIKKIWNWEWDSSLKDWIIDVLQKNLEYYSKLIETLPYIEKKELTEQENEAYKSIISEINNINSEISKANDQLVIIQVEFANKHWYQLDKEEETNISEDNSEETNVLEEKPEESLKEEPTESEENSEEIQAEPEESVESVEISE